MLQAKKHLPNCLDISSRFCFCIWRGAGNATSPGYGRFKLPVLQAVSQNEDRRKIARCWLRYGVPGMVLCWLRAYFWLCCLVSSALWHLCFCRHTNTVRPLLRVIKPWCAHIPYTQARPYIQAILSLVLDYYARRRETGNLSFTQMLIQFLSFSHPIIRPQTSSIIRTTL